MFVTPTLGRSAAPSGWGLPPERRAPQQPQRQLHRQELHGDGGPDRQTAADQCRSKEAYVYYRDGLSAQNDGDYAEALENYEEALKLEDNPTDRGETLKNMAIIYMSNGEEERAIGTYRKALEENPSQPSCLKNMGLIFEKWGRIAEEDGRQDEADRWFDQAPGLDPGGAAEPRRLSRHRKLAQIHRSQQRGRLLERISSGLSEQVALIRPSLRSLLRAPSRASTRLP